MSPPLHQSYLFHFFFFPQYLKFPGNHVSKSTANGLESVLSVKHVWTRPVLPSKPFYKFFASDAWFGGSDFDGSRVRAAHCSTQKSKRRRGAARRGMRMAVGNKHLSCHRIRAKSVKSKHLTKQAVFFFSF